MKLTDDDRAVLDALNRHPDDTGVSAATIAERTGINYDKTVRSLRWLRNFGHIERASKGYRPLQKVTSSN